ncbi:adenylyl-sulfate kinase [Pantoea sp. Mhis]|uniref:adenylyl-sulfate kinase n=1 Tax=Pantoea sp. Mhis TaxID=2576759 RepID=UPI00135B1E4B|nr:adenylyl-sulfate kinase [Pantoea sp. Mhis]MXP56714.1 adenylyl-sulfate kinase [Pantoea sp. Mhis]
MKNYDTNVIWHKHLITRTERENKHGHPGILLWFTGVSGSGKSTLASYLEQALYQRSISTYLLDGDNVRYGLCKDLGFQDNERKENIRRIGEVAKLMLDAGLVVLTALISPYRSERQMVRNLFEKNQYIEVFVDTPLELCETRDPKGLYKKARDGKIKNFTGIDSFYEIPDSPEIHLDGKQDITLLINQLLQFLCNRGLITN